MQRTNRQQHPHKATIDDLIVEIKKKQKNRHEIIITMDGNEEFSSSKGGIAKLCRECKLYDVFSQRFKNAKLPNTHIKESKRVDYILCSFNILKTINRSGMTAFGELVTSNHRGLYIDLPIASISKSYQPDVNQHFQRLLRSSCPRSARNYKKHLQKYFTKREILNRISKLTIIVQTRKLNKIEEKELNNIDAYITKIMLDAETNLNTSITHYGLQNFT